VFDSTYVHYDVCEMRQEGFGAGAGVLKAVLAAALRPLAVLVFIVLLLVVGDHVLGLLKVRLQGLRHRARE